MLDKPAPVFRSVPSFSKLNPRPPSTISVWLELGTCWIHNAPARFRTVTSPPLLLSPEPDPLRVTVPKLSSTRPSRRLFKPLVGIETVAPASIVTVPGPARVPLFHANAPATVTSPLMVPPASSSVVPVSARNPAAVVNVPVVYRNATVP